jgi:hypothetical protein
VFFQFIFNDSENKTTIQGLLILSPGKTREYSSKKGKLDRREQGEE